MNNISECMCITFLVIVTEFRNDLRKEKFILACGFKENSPT